MTKFEFHKNANTARAAKFKYVTHPYQLEYQQPGKGRGSRSAKLLWGSSFRQIGSLQPYACFSQCQIHTCVYSSIFSPTAHLRRGKYLGLSKLWKHALWNFDKGVWNNSLGRVQQTVKNHFFNSVQILLTAPSWCIVLGLNFKKSKWDHPSSDGNDQFDLIATIVIYCVVCGKDIFSRRKCFPLQ